MRKVTQGSSFVYYMMQFVNCFVFLSAILLFATAIYIWILVGLLNSFITTFLLISLFMLLTSIYGFYFTKHSPTAILFYQIFLFILTVFILVLTFFIIFNHDAILDFLTMHMLDSAQTIEQVRIALNNNLEWIRMGMFLFACILGSNLFLSMCYKSTMYVIEVEDDLTTPLL